MRKLDRTIVCLVSDKWHVVRYTDNSIEIKKTGNAFDGDNFSKSFNDIRKEYGCEKDFINTADSIIGAVARDYTKMGISEWLSDKETYDKFMDVLENS